MIPGIEVKIGADTSELDAALAKAGTSLDRAGATAARAGAAMASGLGRGLASASGSLASVASGSQATSAALAGLAGDASRMASAVGSSASRAGAAMASGLGRGVTQASANVSRSFGLIEGAAARLALKSSTAMSGLGNAFTGAGQGAVKASDTTARALDRMSDEAVQSSARTGAALDSALAKYMEFGRASTAIPGNLPGLGGTSIGLPDPFVEPNKGAEKFSGNIGNLAAQFNDIGVTAAMGMSPLMIALQQGTQLSQAFAGQKLGDVAQGLGGALMSMVSPVSLLTIGLTGLVAVGAQWALGAMSAGKESLTLGERLEALTDSTDAFIAASERSLASAAEMVEKYGQLAGVMRNVSAAMADLARADAVAELNAAMASIGETLDVTRYQIQDAMGQITGDFDWAGMADDVGVAENAIAELVVAFDRMSSAQGPEAQARAAADLAARLLEAFGHVDAMPGPMREVYRAALQVAGEAAKIAGETERADRAAKSLAGSVAAAYRAYYNSRVEASKLADETARAAAAMDALSDANRRDAEVYGQVGARGDPRRFAEGGSMASPAGAAPFVFEPPGRGGGGGGGGGGPSLADRLETLRDELATEQETIAEWYAQNMQTLDDALAARALKEQEYRDLREKLEAEHEDRLRGIRGAGQQSALATVLSTGQQILQAVGQTNQKALKAAQAFGAGIALINAYQAASETLKQPGLPWFARIVAAGQVLAAGIGFVNAIKGVNASASGVTSGAGRGAGAAQPVQGPGQTISISYDGPDFARQPIEAVVGQLNDFIKRGGRIDGVMMA